jgi:hypothetical protein
MSLDLEPIKARIARATPGPWRVKEADPRSIHRGTVQVEENGRVIETVAECYCGGYEGHGLHNAELVANAPTDLDALVAEVERLRAEVSRERSVVLDYLAYRIEMSHYSDAIREFVNARDEISEGVHHTIDYSEVLP